MVKAKETKYSVYIRYRDGGLDKYHNVPSAKVEDNCLQIYEGVSITTYIVLDIVSYFRIEKEED